MKVNFLISCLSFFYGATTLACPDARLLNGIMVGNKSMQHKSITFAHGITWGITYTYSIYGLSSDHWGVYGDHHTLALESLPIIELENSNDAVPLSEIHPNGSPHHYRKFCNYTVSKPNSWSPSSDGESTFWKFSLHLDLNEQESTRPSR